MTKKELRLFFLDNDYRSYLSHYEIHGEGFDPATIVAHIDRLKRYVREDSPQRMLTDGFGVDDDYFPEMLELFEPDHDKH